MKQVSHNHTSNHAIMLVAILILSVAFSALAHIKDDSNTGTEKKVCCIQTPNPGVTACISNVPASVCTPSNAVSDTKHRNCCKTKLATCTQFFTYINSTTTVASTCGGHIKVPTSDQTDKK